MQRFLAALRLALSGWYNGHRTRTGRELNERTNEATTSDDKFEAAFEQVAVGMALISPNGKWARINDRFCDISGYSRDEIIGRDFWEITHPDDVPADAAHIDNLLTGRTLRCYAEKRFISPSGDVVWINASASVVRSADGKPEFIVKVVEDITDWKLAQVRLATSEAQYRAIFDSALEAIVVIDEKGVIQSANPAVEQIFGYEPAELGGLNISMLMPKDFADAHDSYLSSYKKTGERAVIGIGREVVGLRRDGSTIPLDLSVAEWRQEGVTFYTGVMRDISERKQAEVELGRSEERLRLAQDATGVGSFDWDLVSGALYGNENFFEMTRSRPETQDHLKPTLQVIHPDDRERVGAQIQHNLTLGDRTDTEFSIVQTQGAPLWVRSLASTAYDKEGNAVRRIGVLIDITDRKSAEEERRRSNERLRLALASGKLGTWEVDVVTGDFELDSLSREIFDLEPGQCPSLIEFQALVHPDDKERVAEALNLIKTHPSVNTEYRIFKRDGTIRWIRSSGTRMEDFNPPRSKVIGVAKDITDEKEADLKVRLLQSEFAHLARINDLSEMAAAIAHEINQPLTAISNYLSAGLTNARKSAESAAPFVDMMDRAADQALRAARIVRELRNFVGKGAGVREICPIDKLIGAAVEFAAIDAGLNGVNVKWRGGAEGAEVNVDAVQVQQVVVNLVRNAIEALSNNAPQDERELVVESRIESGADVDIMVADTGPGIPPQMVSSLFEPFSSSKPNGMGIGLSLCKKLIEAHGGSISYETRAGGGAEFHFSLPIEGMGA